jgi:hypothetical protein
MSIARRRFIKGMALSIPAFRILQGLPAAAQVLEPGHLPRTQEIWDGVLFVNSQMGPTRLTGSPQHQAFVDYLFQQLEQILTPKGGQVFKDTFANYPRWTATSVTLNAGGTSIPVASYFPYCTGGFTGTRSPLVPATAIAAPGTGGGYPRADGTTVKILPPTTSATGTVVNLGTFSGPGSINWSGAQGKIAYVDYPANVNSPSSSYTVNETYDVGLVNAEDYVNPITTLSSLRSTPDISNATKAGVLGVILGWVGISDGNAAGQYNPFPVPYSSFPPSSQAGSDPSTTIGGIPALWVTEGTGTFIKNNLAGQNAPVTITLEADIQQVDSSTVWGILPGQHYSSPQDQFLVNNTHTDGPNIVEENGGIGVINVAKYFARLPRSQRPKSMIFMASTGHFGHGFLGSGGDWITQHPQIIANTVGTVTIEHFGCNEWLDTATDSGLVFEPTGKLLQDAVIVTHPGFTTAAPGPAAPTLLSIIETALDGSFDRAVVLSGGAFSGEGGRFHNVGIPTIGYIPIPLYLCSVSDNGEIDKVNPKKFHAQVEVTVKCLLSMQRDTAAQLAL